MIFRLDPLVFCSLVLLTPLDAFSPSPTSLFGVRPLRSTDLASSSVAATDDYAVDSVSSNQEVDNDDTLPSSHSMTAVRAPLKYIGPYPCLGMRLPDLATTAQRSRNVTGVSLDFVLDTAANTNTINVQVAQELQLERVGSALPGVGSAGVMDGGDTFLLGDAQLEGVGNAMVAMGEVNKNDDIDMDGDDPFVFMQNLTASALPVASASAGLLSLPFFYCFEGGVEFDWGSPPTVSNEIMRDGMTASSAITGNPPSVTFHGAVDPMLQATLSEMTRVSIDPVPVTQLPSVMVEINGCSIPALLDTGSPVTVLNSQAAKQVGLEAVSLPGGEDMQKSGGNPFTNFAKRFQHAQAMAQAASKGDVLTLAGTNGQPTYLLKSQGAPAVVMRGDNDQEVSFGNQMQLYVGDLPGLAALNGLGVDSPPAMVLGMDILRQRPKMVLRARDNEVYF